MEDRFLLAKQEKSTNINEWVLEKERISHNFIEEQDKIKGLQINLGDVYNCEIGENIGEEQCNSRPVLVVSKTFYNSRSSNVTVIPLSTTIRMRQVIKQGKTKNVLKVRTHFRLKKNDFPFLSADSVVKCEHIRSVSKSRLTSKLGQIDVTTLNKVQNRISDLLDL